MRIRLGAIEGGDLKKHGPHLLLQIAELHKVSLSLVFRNEIHLQYAIGMRSINGSWVKLKCCERNTGLHPSETHTEAPDAAGPVNQSRLTSPFTLPSTMQALRLNPDHLYFMRRLNLSWLYFHAL